MGIKITADGKILIGPGGAPVADCGCCYDCATCTDPWPSDETPPNDYPWGTTICGGIKDSYTIPGGTIFRNLVYSENTCTTLVGANYELKVELLEDAVCNASVGAWQWFSDFIDVNLTVDGVETPTTGDFVILGFCEGPMGTYPGFTLAGDATPTGWLVAASSGGEYFYFGFKSSGQPAGVYAPIWNCDDRGAAIDWIDTTSAAVSIA